VAQNSRMRRLAADAESDATLPSEAPSGRASPDRSSADDRLTKTRR
jgi:hypothetical protein